MMKLSNDRYTDSSRAFEELRSVQPIERSRLYEEVLERIESLIVSGKLKPGDQLPSERDLMSLFGVGRPSIREALFALQRKGVIAATSGGRPVVTTPKADTMIAEFSTSARMFISTEGGAREFQRVRRLFEPSIAREAALCAGPEDIARLRKALDANADAIDDPERFVDTDVLFHFEIVKVTRSELLISLHRSVFEWLREQRVLSIGPSGSADAALEAHRKIFKAIEDRDPEAVEFAMRQHLEEVEQFYWSAKDQT